eukprot:9733090-Lingulodinium_polyedra.AAC.2
MRSPSVFFRKSVSRRLARACALRVRARGLHGVFRGLVFRQLRSDKNPQPERGVHEHPRPLARACPGFSGFLQSIASTREPGRKSATNPEESGTRASSLGSCSSGSARSSTGVQRRSCVRIAFCAAPFAFSRAGGAG